MEVTKIPATKRTEIGKRQVVRVREAGSIPVVVYGMGKEPEHLAVPGRDVERELRLRHRVFQLQVEGQDQAVFLQDLQADALTDQPLHIDFLRIDLDTPMHFEVELTFVGVPVGTAQGGVLTRDLNRLKIKALPAALPQEIEVKVVGVDVGDSILAKDLELPEGVMLDVPEDTTICHIGE
jgi:large subunit ribosomal protein L25